MTKARIHLPLIITSVLSFCLLIGILYFLIQDQIKTGIGNMENRMMTTIPAVIEKKISAIKTFDPKETMENRRRTNENLSAIHSLEKALFGIQTQIPGLRNQLSGIRANLRKKNQKQRDEVHALITASDRRIQNLEKLAIQVTKDLQRIEEAATRIPSKSNTWYEVQITYEPESESESIVDHINRSLRKQGFRTSTWPNIQKMQKIYGVSMASLNNNISVLPAPGETAIGRKITKILHEDSGLPMIRTGVDKAANSQPTLIGLLIPPTYKAPKFILSKKKK
jgi:hypothetical protein